jgi:hypothetical protein
VGSVGTSKGTKTAATRTPRLRAALGLKVRTGRAVVVVVCGPAEAPQVLAKAQIDVATTFEEGAVFHAAQEMPIEAGRAHVRDAERRFVRTARDGLAAFVGGVQATVVGAGMAAPVAKTLPPFETIVKAHPMVHAAEGELYRRVFAEAAAAVAAPPERLPADALASRVAEALETTPARLAARLAAIGKASGRPWAADQKEATLAAWAALLAAHRR